MASHVVDLVTIQNQTAAREMQAAEYRTATAAKVVENKGIVTRLRMR